MPVFEYKAFTENGRMIYSKMNIDGNELAVRNKLTQMGLKPISIKKKKFDMEDFMSKFKQVKPKNKRGAIGVDEAVLVEDKYFEQEKQQSMLKLKKNQKLGKIF